MTASSNSSQVACFLRWEWRWIRRLRLTAGRFGVLAGDTLRAMVDLGVLMIGITFVHRISPLTNKTIRQRACRLGPGANAEALEPQLSVPIERLQMKVRAWLFMVIGHSN